jgi:hypothetical protein
MKRNNPNLITAVIVCSIAVTSFAAETQIKPDAPDPCVPTKKK